MTQDSTRLRDYATPRQDLKTQDDLKKFGLTVGIVFILIATLALYRHRLPLGSVLLSAGALLVTCGLLRPLLLKRTHWAWMKLASVLAYVNTRIILGLVFFVIFAPVGVLLRIFGQDPLDRGIDKNANSYWKDVGRRELSAEQYQNPF